MILALGFLRPKMRSGANFRKALMREVEDADAPGAENAAVLDVADCVSCSKLSTCI